MKKIYLLALSAIFGVSAMAQVSVTFQVDMNDQTVSPNGVHVAGSWQFPAGETEDPDGWDPGASEMTDDNSDGIYSLTVDVPAGAYGFKYVNGNAWGMDESVPAIARIGNDRGFAVTVWHADNGGLTLPPVLYAGAAPEGMIPVRLATNVSQLAEVSPLGVHVAGDLITPTWEPEYGTAMMVNPDEYAYITYVEEPGTYEYKFLNGDFWGTDEWNGLGQDSLPPCANGSLNRTLEVVPGGVSTPAYCFEACETCSEPNVILTVNMSNETVTDGVFLAGSFNTFGNEPMTDNGDGTYSVELTLEPGTYQFKFKNGPGDDGWEDVPPSCRGEGTPNREFTVAEAEELSITMCYEQCVAECAPNPDPSDITFRVNMDSVTVSPDGVWVMGGFTTPPWQTGAIEMTDDDGDGVYEVTVVAVSGSADIVYKFANGNPTEIEENGNFEAGGCGVPSGVNNGFNRTLLRTGEPMVLEVVCYNACVNCNLVGLEEIGLGEVTLFPNPSNGLTYLDIQNPSGYTLIMSIVDITGKTVRENVVLNSTRNEINTKGLNAGLYFLNIVNEHNDRSVYKLVVR